MQNEPTILDLDDVATAVGTLIESLEVARDKGREFSPAPTEGRVADVAEAIFAKALDELRAVNLLLLAGPLSTCWIHTRSLWEQMVNLAYIAQAPEERAERFTGYFVILSKKWVDAARKDHRYARLLEDGYGDHVDTAYDELIKAGMFHARSRTWSGQNLRQMAAAVGAEEDYPVYYSFLSQHAHPSIVGVGHPEAKQPGEQYTCRQIQKLSALSAVRLGLTYGKVMNFDLRGFRPLEALVLDDDFFWGPAPPVDS